MAKINKKELLRIEKMVQDWPFFQDFSKEEIEDAIHKMSLRRVEKNEIIFREEDPGDYLFLLLDGKIEISLTNHAKAKIIAIIEAGGIVGEMSVLDDETRSATAKAYEDSEILILTRDKLDSILREEPPIGIKFLKQVSRIVANRLRSMVGNFAEIS
ncbi:MAG: cyclic nucleotide-binding domain-containing protein [Nitrospinae bacterium]|nr:cyclic nucleotide-binding domain-containing protein [Nitrospinota bacterium]